jgi:hypothetical protein
MTIADKHAGTPAANIGIPHAAPAIAAPPPNAPDWQKHCWWARVLAKARQVSLTTTRVVIIMIGFALVKPMREMAARCSNFGEQGEMQSTRIALGWAAGSVNPNK